MANRSHSRRTRSLSPVAITPINLWSLTRERKDADEFLDCLKGYPVLTAQFLHFESLNITSERIEHVQHRTRQELRHLFSRMATLEFQELTFDFFQKKGREYQRFQPYRARTRTPSPNSSDSSVYVSTRSSPEFPRRASELPTSPPPPSVVRTTTSIQTIPTPELGTRENPINVDTFSQVRFDQSAIAGPSNRTPLVRHDTPHPSVAILERPRHPLLFGAELRRVACSKCGGTNGHYRECTEFKKETN
jgi:hypothetical protein